VLVYEPVTSKDTADRPGDQAGAAGGDGKRDGARR
jgi:hypothetical protein